MEKEIELYVSSYNSVSNQRIYVLIAVLIINFFLFIFQTANFLGVGANKILFSLLLAIGAIFFAILSKQLLLYLLRIHRSRYEILLSKEKIYEEEWKLLQQEGADSSVFYSRLEEYQSYFFIVAQCLSFSLNLANKIGG